MDKKNKSNKQGKTSFWRHLMIALAPQDELMRYVSRQAPKEDRIGTETDHQGNPMFILSRSARHLGSI